MVGSREHNIGADPLARQLANQEQGRQPILGAHVQITAVGRARFFGALTMLFTRSEIT
jgi:hypothetical protein